MRITTPKLLGVFAALAALSCGSQPPIPGSAQGGVGVPVPAPEGTDCAISAFPQQQCGLVTSGLLHPADGRFLGRVAVLQDATHLYLGYALARTPGGFVGGQAHVAASLAGLPLTSGGDPDLTRFACRAELDVPADLFLFKVPRTACDTQNRLCYVAARALVSETFPDGSSAAEEAWAGDLPLGAASDPKHFLAPLNDCEPAGDPAPGR